MSQSFQRHIENFTCEHCKEEVQGNGYTNHCPKCLWSKHVDIKPGDRAETCHGMMEPIGLEITGREERIIYRCVRCGKHQKNIVKNNDDRDALVQLSTKRVVDKPSGIAH